jgi:alkanesulfonate monooxygenase SsuD/methylene tetrahydromethanopterin reductase-like flavin-dependent oxidoreductase (luciferase family)
VAAITRRAELGTLVTPPFFRNPAVLAKQIATIDHVSGGRVIAGLGAGWYDAEFRGYGCEFPALRERQVALDETCQILRGLWTQPEFQFEGEHYRLEKTCCEPKPLRHTPILVGGAGEKHLLRIAARHADIWNNNLGSIGLLPRKIEALVRHCAELGRAPGEVEISQLAIAVIAADDTAARDSLDRARRVYGPKMTEGLEEHGLWGSPERLVSRIRELAKLGCTLFVIDFFGKDPLEPARFFAREVAPAFRESA